MDSVSVKVVCAGAIGLCAAYLLKKKLLQPAPFPTAAAPLGSAHIYRLKHVDRTDMPGGKGNKGKPGQPAAHYLHVGPCEGDTTFGSLLQGGSSKFMLYAVEQGAGGGWAEPLLVFLELEAAALQQLYVDEAFLDRGVRKLVPLGSRVAVCSIVTAEGFLAADPLAAGLFDGRDGAQLGIVWNTGRCGSTLLGEALARRFEHIAAGDVEAGAVKRQRHVAAHLAKADDGDFHEALLDCSWNESLWHIRISSRGFEDGILKLP